MSRQPAGPSAAGASVPGASAPPPPAPGASAARASLFVVVGPLALPPPLHPDTAAAAASMDKSAPLARIIAHLRDRGGPERATIIAPHFRSVRSKSAIVRCQASLAAAWS